MSSAALTLHLKKYLKTPGLNVRSIDDVNPDNVVTALKKNHPAYKMENQVELRASVIEALTTILSQSVGSVSLQ